MPINSDKPHLWKADVARSITFFNHFVPNAMRKQRPIRPKESLVPSIKTDTLKSKQYSLLMRWLSRHGYKQISADYCGNLDTMPAGSFTYCQPLSPGKKKSSSSIPTDYVVKPFGVGKANPPVIIRAKTFISFSNAIRSAKRDGRKFIKFKESYPPDVRYILLLGGYVDVYYLGPQAVEGADWVWQHGFKLPDEMKAASIWGVDQIRQRTQNLAERAYNDVWKL